MNKVDQRTLVLVYNADFSVAGLLKAAGEYVRGIESCSLCEITHNGAVQDSNWKQCRVQLPLQVKTAYRNKLTNAQRKALTGFPSVLLYENDAYTEIIPPAEIDAMAGDAVKLGERIRQILGL